MLPQKAIDEFKKIYKRKFDKNLTEKEAQYRANNLLALYKAIFGKNTEKLNLKVRVNY